MVSTIEKPNHIVNANHNSNIDRTIVTMNTIMKIILLISVHALIYGNHSEKTVLLEEIKRF